jgi:hypothetical protein
MDYRKKPPIYSPPDSYSGGTAFMSESEGEILRQSSYNLRNSVWTNNGIVNYVAHDRIFPLTFHFNML